MRTEKMEKEEEKIDIFYTIKPVARFMSLCGLWPHTIQVRSLRKNLRGNSSLSHAQRSSPGITTGGLLWFFVVFATYVYAFYANLQKSFWETFREVTKSVIQTYGNWMQVLSGLLIGN
jgi:hypothetical protein